MTVIYFLNDPLAICKDIFPRMQSKEFFQQSFNKKTQFLQMS